MIADITANERAFIGCLLRSPHEFWQVNDVVTADCLTMPITATSSPPSGTYPSAASVTTRRCRPICPRNTTSSGPPSPS
jgi:hypothetical protein